MSWSRAGTVAVTNGSQTVTGINTGFAANTRVGDAFIGPDGRQYELGNVASDTVISIIPAYQGPSASGAAYSIMPVQGYQKGLADQVRDWVNVYGQKMAGLGTTGNYDVLPVAKGGTGGATPAAARAGLGLSNAAVATILGTVSQAGGVPTGALSEFGFNANGEYYKFACGLMICTFTGTGSVSLTSTYGSCSFASVNWNFPATFVGTLPKIDGSAYVTGRIVTVAPAAAQQLYSSSMYVVDLSINGTTVSVLLKYLAVGRWF